MKNLILIALMLVSFVAMGQTTFPTTVEMNKFHQDFNFLYGDETQKTIHKNMVVFKQMEPNISDVRCRYILEMRYHTVVSHFLKFDATGDEFIKELDQHRKTIQMDFSFIDINSLFFSIAEEYEDTE